MSAIFISRACAAWEILELQLAVALLFQGFTHGFLGDHGRVALGVDVGDLDIEGMSRLRQEGQGQSGDQKRAFEIHDLSPVLLFLCLSM
jgi:hypothetical protein